MSCYVLFTRPASSDSTKSTMKMKKMIFAMAAAPVAIPPNPSNAAIKAMIKNVIVQRIIT